MTDRPISPVAASASKDQLIYCWYVVAVLMFAYTVAFIDRQILSLLVQPIKRDLKISDTQVSLLAGFAFAVFYTVLGVPLARLADGSNRKRLIALGVLIWSVMTAVCGLANSYWILFIARVGVGIGEATISPAAYSMIADYFPRTKLARAISVYVVGLYVGAGLAIITGSIVVKFVSSADTLILPLLGQVFPWQVTFFLVALLGLPVLALIATVREPERREFSASDSVISTLVPFSEVWKFLRSHGQFFAAHFAGYGFLGAAITAYLTWIPELLRRSHHIGIADAGFIFGVVLLVCGTLGPTVAASITARLRSRGHGDAELRTSILAGIGMIPTAVAMPLAPTLPTAVGLLCLALFFLSAPQGLAPTLIQLVTPNRMRAQVTAVFMLTAVLAGYTVGPASVAILTDYVFRNESSLPYSLSIVSAVLIPMGLLCLKLGLKPLRGLMPP